VKSRNNGASSDITAQALEGDIRCALGSRRRLRAPGAQRSRSCATDPDREHQASDGAALERDCARLRCRRDTRRRAAAFGDRVQLNLADGRTDGHLPRVVP